MTIKKTFMALNKSQGLVGAPANSMDALKKQIASVVDSKRQQGPFTVYEAVMQIEVEKIITEFKETPIQQAEPGYQAEGFAAAQQDDLTAEAIARNGFDPGKLQSDPDWDRNYVADTVRR